MRPMSQYICRSIPGEPAGTRAVHAFSSAATAPIWRITRRALPLWRCVCGALRAERAMIVGVRTSGEERSCSLSRRASSEYISDSFAPAASASASRYRPRSSKIVGQRGMLGSSASSLACPTSGTSAAPSCKRGPRARTYGSCCEKVVAGFLGESFRYLFLA